MNTRTKMFVATAMLAGTLLVGATSTHAGWFGGDSETNLIDRIVSKFKLNKTDVQKVFTDYRGERQVEMLTKMEDKLTTLVKDGKLTEAQKKLILAKHKELQAKKQADIAKWQSMTVEERRAAMDAQRTELQNWAKQNNIDISYVMGFGNGPGMGRGMGRGMGWNK